MPDILNRSDLRSFFTEGFKPAEAWGIGLEYERFGIVGSPSRPAPLPLEGPVSIAAILEQLTARFGWIPKAEEGRTIELARGMSRITLEPGLQMELSGGVHRTVAAAADELGTYLREVLEVSRPMGVQWLAAGTHPVAPLDAIPWLPKSRYAIMREYLPARGGHAHQMMKGTCGMQVNLDFADEADGVEKLRAAMILSSLVTALFANSPITDRRPNGYLTERAAIWLDTDPDRCGLLRFALEPSGSFDDYVAYGLSVPMFFLSRPGRYMPMKGLTFGAFLERGFEGERATIEDWEVHLTTLFPDVRLKRYLEVRASDSNAPDLVLAHAALWKGILYGGQEVRSSALAPFSSFRWEDHLQLRIDVAKLGPRAAAAGRSLLEIGSDVIDLAAAGLAASDCQDDARFLDPLRELVQRRKICPADDVLARFDRSPGGDLESVIDLLARLHPVL